MLRWTVLFGTFAVIGALILEPTPAGAQGYRLYPWCAYYTGRMGASNCYFSTYEQCRAAVSGVGGSCNVNPFYAAYGSYYSFNRNSYPRRGTSGYRR